MSELREKGTESILITMSTFLTEQEFTESSLLLISTKDEQLFDYLHHLIQTEMQTYQPGKSKKHFKTMNPLGIPKKQAGPSGSLLPADLINLEMRFKDFQFIVEHLTLRPPISFIVTNIEEVAVIDYTQRQSLLLGILKFIKNLQVMKISGTRGAVKLLGKPAHELLT